MSQHHHRPRGGALFLMLGAMIALRGLLAAPPAWGAEEEYLIGVDDVLYIQVWDHKELEQTMPVRPDGRISFPLVGEVRASGLTSSQLAEVLTTQLSKSVKNPTVSVVVREIRSLRVFFVGRVARPGVYPIKPGIRLLQALTLAGGLAQGAGTSAYVVRGDQKIALDLGRLIQEADLSQNLLLQPDDTIVVPEGGDLRSSVFIMGEVTRPGSYSQSEALTLMKLVSLAGGFTQFAAPGRITIIRENAVAGSNGDPNGKHKVRLSIDVNAIQRNPAAHPDLPLEPGDVVVVPQTRF